MILQSDKRLPEAINIFGCYFMSVLFLAGRRKGKEFEADEIVGLYRACVQTGILGKEVRDKDGKLTDGCFVNDPVSLFAVAGSAVHSVVKVDAAYKAAKDELELLCFYRAANTPAGMGNSEHTHFVAGYNGKVAFDPLGNSNTVKYGILKSKRIFK